MESSQVHSKRRHVLQLWWEIWMNLLTKKSPERPEQKKTIVSHLIYFEVTFWASPKTIKALKEKRFFKCFFELWKLYSETIGGESHATFWGLWKLISLVNFRGEIERVQTNLRRFGKVIAYKQSWKFSQEWHYLSHQIFWEILAENETLYASIVLDISYLEWKLIFFSIFGQFQKNNQESQLISILMVPISQGITNWI